MSVTKKTKTGIKINFPKVITVRLGDLIWPGLNREDNENHITKMMTTIINEGMMDLVKVFSINLDGKYLVAEGNHRVQALLNLFGPDLEIQVAVLDWKDETDIESVQNTIIKMNTQNKAWTLYDYVKSHSQMKGKSNVDLYKNIRTDMIAMKNQIANGVVATFYDKSERTHKSMKEGSFQIKQSDQQYIDILKGYCKDLVSMNGKTKLNGPYMRRLVSYLWNQAEEYNDVMKFHSLLHQCTSVITSTVQSGGTLEDGDETFKDWFAVQCQMVDKTYVYTEPIEELV